MSLGVGFSGPAKTLEKVPTSHIQSISCNSAYLTQRNGAHTQTCVEMLAAALFIIIPKWSTSVLQLAFKHLVIYPGCGILLGLEKRGTVDINNTWKNVSELCQFFCFKSQPWSWDVTQLAECSPSTHKSLSLLSSPA